MKKIYILLSLLTIQLKTTIIEFMKWLTLFLLFSSQAFALEINDNLREDSQVPEIGQNPPTDVNEGVLETPQTIEDEIRDPEVQDPEVQDPELLDEDVSDFPPEIMDNNESNTPEIDNEIQDEFQNEESIDKTHSEVSIHDNDY